MLTDKNRDLKELRDAVVKQKQNMKVYSIIIYYYYM